VLFLPEIESYNFFFFNFHSQPLTHDLNQRIWYVIVRSKWSTSFEKQVRGCYSKRGLLSYWRFCCFWCFSLCWNFFFCVNSDASRLYYCRLLATTVAFSLLMLYPFNQKKKKKKKKDNVIVADMDADCWHNLNSKQPKGGTSKIVCTS